MTVDARLVVRLANAIKIGGTADAPTVDPSSMMTLRALGLELNKHRDWTLAVGARPDKAGEPAALSRAFAIVHRLTLFTHRDGVAETVGWDAVKVQPGNESGVGLLILVAPKAPTATQQPAQALPQKK